jgi:hypothetical protein
MKKIFPIFILMMVSNLAFSQVRPFVPESLFPEANSKAKFHTVKGERHGPSFFKKFNFPEVEYVPGETLSFDKYHTVDVMYHWYQKWATQFPDLVDLYVVAESFEGRSIRRP